MADLGNSLLKHEAQKSSKGQGTARWAAPEVLREEPASEKADVYSFGVVLWELVTGRLPWDGVHPLAVINLVGSKQRRLEIPNDVEEGVRQLLLDCWEENPLARPSFQNILDRLEGMTELKRSRTWAELAQDSDDTQ